MMGISEKTMIKKKAFHTDNAPSAIGVYSQAVKAGGFMFISGQIPLEPKSMKVVSGSFNEQAKRVLLNLQAIILDAGSSVDNVVKINVYLTNLRNFQNFNLIMEEFFKKPYPSRAVVEVSRLPKDVDIEIDAIVISND